MFPSRSTDILAQHIRLLRKITMREYGRLQGEITVQNAAREILTAANPLKIRLLADHFQAKKDYSKALLFSYLAVAFLDPKDPARQGYFDYIRDFQVLNMFGKPHKEFTLMQIFLMGCMTLSKEKLVQLTKLGSENPFGLILRVIDDELESVKKLESNGILTEDELKIVKARLEKSITALYWETGIKNMLGKDVLTIIRAKNATFLDPIALPTLISIGLA